MDPNTGRVAEAYPALRMRRLRRAGGRPRSGPASSGEARPAQTEDSRPAPARPASTGDPRPAPARPAPTEDSRPARARPASTGDPRPAPARPDAPAPTAGMDDMEAATIIARPQFDDVRPAPEAPRPMPMAPSPDPFDDEIGGPGAAAGFRRYGAFREEDAAPGDRLPDELRDHSGLQHKAGATRPRADWGLGADAAPVPPPDDESMVDARDDVRRRYAGLDMDLDASSPSRPRRVDRARLSSPRRSDVGTKRVTAGYDEDALLAEVAKAYSRDYHGRDGWSAGALWDSVRYTFRLAGKSASRPMAVRRLRKEREGRERIRQDHLSELGEVALALRDLDTPLLGDFRDRQLELQHEQEMRDEELADLGRRLEEATRAFASAERQHALEEEELKGHQVGAEDQLRPVEVDYRSALKKARAAEEDGRALAQQIDRARHELGSLANRPGTGDEVVRLKAKVERWQSERDALGQEVPRLEARAADLLPEIERQRKELDRAQQALREHREVGVQREAEHKRERQRLGQEMERLNVAKETLAGQRRGLWLECGRQLDIDRPAHDHLEEIYQELDHTAAEVRRIDQEIEIARSPPGPPNYDALKRAGVALSAVFVLIILIVLVTSA